LWQSLDFETRGVILTPDDLSLSDWPRRAKKAGLSTIALHPFPGVVMDFIRSEKGEHFLSQSREPGLQVEYELHAMKELLPRRLFEKDRDPFRMDEKGERTPDANLCIHSESAMEIVAENAIAIGKVLRPTTGRYFYWGDDGQPWCRCPKCRHLSDSDQALILENRLLDALRTEDPTAQLAHLAYHNTLWPPEQIKPKSGIFLEYAPIHRRYDIPYASQRAPSFQDSLEALDANLEVFGKDNAQVLEYWLDASRFSGWKKPAVPIPWDHKVFLADLDTYGSRGIRHITSFAVYIDAEYVQRYGAPPLEEYGAGLAKWQPC